LGEGGSLGSGDGESPGSGDGESLGSGDADGSGEADGSGDGLGSGLTETEGLGDGSPPDEERCGAAFAIVPAITTAANVVSMSLTIFMGHLSAAR